MCVHMCVSASGVVTSELQRFQRDAHNPSPVGGRGHLPGGGGAAQCGEGQDGCPELPLPQSSPAWAAGQVGETRQRMMVRT